MSTQDSAGQRGEIMVSVRATDLLLALRCIHGAVTPAERAAVGRLRTATHEAAAKAAEETAAGAAEEAQKSC
jgi:hypothetical protein